MHRLDFLRDVIDDTIEFFDDVFSDVVNLVDVLHLRRTLAYEGLAGQNEWSYSSMTFSNGLSDTFLAPPS